MSRLRVAFFSPFNPLRSGISDHSEELLPYLAQSLDMYCVVDDYPRSNRAIDACCTFISPAQFLADTSRYDTAIYQVGNHLTHHRYMIPCMQKFPGILALQDYAMGHLILGLTLGAGDLGALEDCLVASCGADSKSLARRIMLQSRLAEGVSFAEPLIRMARAVVVNSRYALGRMQTDHPAKYVELIDLGIPLPTMNISVAEARAAWGMAEDDFVLMSLSTLTSAKRIDYVLTALRDLRARHRNLKFVIVGGGSLDRRSQELVVRYGLEDVVRRTGWVSTEQYQALSLLSDVVVDLRQTTGAETASSLLRGLAAGKPAIISAQGSFLEMPDEFCIKVSMADESGAPFQQAVEFLLAHPDKCVAMGTRAKAYVEATLTLDQEAAAFVALAERVASAGDALPARPALLPSRASLVSRVLVASLYRTSKVADLYRRYGARDLLDRVGARMIRRR